MLALQFDDVVIATGGLPQTRCSMSTAIST